VVEKSPSCLPIEEVAGTAPTPNVIQFPADEEARTRLGFEQVRLHIEELDRELQRLARGEWRSPGGWARQTATPLVRMRCIRSCLTSLFVAGPEVPARHRRRWRDAEDTRHELNSVLSATATSVARLSDPAVGAAERREVLKELPLHRARHRRTFAALLELHGVISGEQSGADS
jgi:hypothetical protein